MTSLTDRVRKVAEAFAAAIMALMFATFIVQVAIRYTARLEWIAEAVPLLDPSRYGWTLEFCLALWVWLIFLGNAFVVGEKDHVTFDILYTSVNPRLRRWFVIIAGLAICIGFLWSIAPTWDRFHILRLKKTATLSQLLGGWIRMRDIYAIYILFLVAVALRYAWRVWGAFRHGVDEPGHRIEGRLDE